MYNKGLEILNKKVNEMTKLVGHNIKNNDKGRRCLKIPLTCMCVVVRTSFPGPDFVNSSLPPHPPNWSLNPLKKLFYSQC